MKVLEIRVYNPASDEDKTTEIQHYRPDRTPGGTTCTNNASFTGWKAPNIHIAYRLMDVRDTSRGYQHIRVLIMQRYPYVEQVIECIGSRINCWKRDDQAAQRIPSQER